jgi:hypothetical protein
MEEESRGFYHKSNMGPGSGKPAPEQQEQSDPAHGDVSGADVDHLSYPSLASQGLEEIELPRRDSTSSTPFKVEKILARNIGSHISRQIENALTDSDTSEASSILNWYVGACEGAQLLDEGTLKDMKKLAHRFATASDPEGLFIEQIQPWLANLRPRRR